MASSWPKTTILRSRSRVLRESVSDMETFFGGMRAILETMVSTSTTSMRFLRLALRPELHVGAGLVDHVDGLVRQVAVVDVLGRSSAAARNAGWCS